MTIASIMISLVLKLSYVHGEPGNEASLVTRNEVIRYNIVIVRVCPSL